MNQLPDYPRDWRLPDLNSINLSGAEIIGVDVETRDPDLIEKGPGRFRGDGFLCGVALSVGPREGEQWYLPIRHQIGPNFDPDGPVLYFLRDALANPKQKKIGANLLYDLEWLADEDIRVEGELIDTTSVVEPLIDENRFSYSLGNIWKKYTGGGKDESELYEWLATAFGGKPTRKQQAGRIWQAPSALVASYAMSDVTGPFEIWEEQRKIVDSEGLWDVLKVEQRLMPMLLAMRERGVRIDEERARHVSKDMSGKIDGYREELLSHGIDSPWKQIQIAEYCAQNVIEYQRTADDNPSFPSDWLKAHADDVLRLVAEVRRLEKSAGTFVDNAILSNVIDGRIHCQFNQLRGDEYGTVSGRFSSSNPNLQNIPARDEELGPLIRGLFIPDEGEDWVSDDWSQIEYRFLVHYAHYATRNYEKAHKVLLKTVERYREDPATDFHAYVAEISSIERKPAKNINFGLVYGMGEPTMAANMGRSLSEIKPIFDQYHEEFPFVKIAYNELRKRAENVGYIKTILGRRRRWHLWQSRDWGKKDEKARNYDDALEEWGFASKVDGKGIGNPNPKRIRRAYCNKALNALLQGSAADAMKLAMADIWDAGICKILGAPLLTVHDELNWSRPRTKEAVEAHGEARRIMAECVKLRVPLLVDSGIGDNWAEAK